MRRITPGKDMRRHWSTISLTPLLFFLTLVTAGYARVGEPSGAGAAPSGMGSLPGRLFPDGTVCLTAAKDSARCDKILFKLPDEILTKNVSLIFPCISLPCRPENNFFKVPGTGEESKRYFSFDGIFDLDNDGEPEVDLLRPEQLALRGDDVLIKDIHAACRRFSVFSSKASEASAIASAIAS